MGGFYNHITGSHIQLHHTVEDVYKVTKSLCIPYIPTVIQNNIECQQHFKYHHSEKNKIKYMYIDIAFIFIDLRCKHVSTLTNTILRLIKVL